MKRVKWILIASVFVIGQAVAGFPTADIQEFKGSYQGEEGTATAKVFMVPEVNFGNGEVNFEVFKQASSYVLKANGQEFVWENPPMELDQVNNLNWNGVNLKSTEEEFQIAVAELSGSGEKDAIDVEGMKASCLFEDSQAQEQAEQLLHSCLNNQGNFAARKMAQNKYKSLNAITNINFRNKKNRFTFNLTSGVSMYGNGMIWYLPEEKMVKIRIDSAKWKYFSVKARLFKELEAMESDTVKVNNPWIEIQLEQ